MTFYNPALRQEPRYEPAAVIPIKQGDSLLDWLASNGRLSPRETVEDTYSIDDTEEEIAALMDVDDKDFDDEDDFLDNGEADDD